MPTEAPRDPLALAGLLQLVSPALPIGAFAWSQGLESAFELDWVRDEATLEAWLAGVLDDGLTRCELPVLARAQRAWAAGDGEALVHWNVWLAANRETAELLEEERRLGAALVRLLGNLDLLPRTAPLPESPGYVVMFAAAAERRGVAIEETLLGFAWAWLENQLTVACKALPLGQTAAQRIIERLRPRLAEAVDTALALDDEELGPALPGLALASALHETQYSRLFRS
ncbi:MULTISPECIES: urease accessory protein UreF [unclassified Modicisalibacter]|uniref:urease accessory protein UreF n=1 Tax=unclassified Modicisalibacter TaxID=2679913 RepID=UPI001CCF3DF8|nr:MULTISPECIES: urease accessory protein UreF [unclassified Modicisalibacter]MBZ9557119.1 urease accessory protein UreF [Modicisalibacter sp. R2A 31.J]MBZ9574167.1 urease accessory protein UreF [Modicisalibacter sp. MOD 31.J]